MSPMSSQTIRRNQARKASKAMVDRLGVALAAALCVTVGACDLKWGGSETEQAETPPATIETPPAQEPETETASDPEPVEGAAVSQNSQIDWEAARRDLASSNERSTSFNIQSGSSAPPVPVLLPSGPVRTASADGPQPQFRPTPDGYYAFYPGQDYTMTVNGTNVVTSAESGSTATRSENLRYVETTTGAMVSFSRYGADYMVEFECLGSGEEGGSCISEEEALSVAEEIVISGTQ